MEANQQRNDSESKHGKVTRANGGQLPQQTYRLNNQLVEEAGSKLCGHHNNKK
jgi:hypothetical protein